MQKLTRFKVSTIFKARTRIVDVRIILEENTQMRCAEGVG
jgi:hypothetical protein